MVTATTTKKHQENETRQTILTTTEKIKETGIPIIKGQQNSHQSKDEIDKQQCANVNCDMGTVSL